MHGHQQHWEQVLHSGRDESYPFSLNAPSLAAPVALPPPSGCDSLTQTNFLPSHAKKVYVQIKRLFPLPTPTLDKTRHAC